MDILAMIFRRWMRHTEKALYRRRFGKLSIRPVGGATLVSYADKDGFDYGAYRAVQEAGNRRKLDSVAVDQRTVAAVVEFARSRGSALRFVLCHGTRNGAEQAMFRTQLGGDAVVLGTEISSTAERFPDTIQWDFHDIRGGWLGAADLIFSNSWDHTYDPFILFPAWAACLKPGGLLALEHTLAHEASVVSALDPFGATLAQLEEIVLSSTRGGLSKAAIIDGHMPERPDRKVAIFTRTSEGSVAGSAAAADADRAGDGPA